MAGTTVGSALTSLGAPRVVGGNVLRHFPKTLPAIRLSKGHRDPFHYDPYSNGPHEHGRKGPMAPIAGLLTGTRGAQRGTLTPLWQCPSLSLIQKRAYTAIHRRGLASKFTVTDSRDALYEASHFGDVERAGNVPEANRAFTYFMVGATGVLGAMGAKSTVMNFLTSWSASSEALAMAQVEVDLSSIPEGKSVVIKWRGKPIFIRHRTAGEIEEANSVNVAELRDPQRDQERTQKPEWIVMLGICTHLGCVPLANSGDYNGWYCPCQ